MMRTFEPPHWFPAKQARNHLRKLAKPRETIRSYGSSHGVAYWRIVNDCIGSINRISATSNLETVWAALRRHFGFLNLTGMLADVPAKR